MRAPTLLPKNTVQCAAYISIAKIRIISCSYMTCPQKRGVMILLPMELLLNAKPLSFSSPNSTKYLDKEEEEQLQCRCRYYLS